MSNVKRGEIYIANLDGALGSEQGGLRPVLIIQNDIGNKFSPTVQIAPLTTKLSKPKLPTHIGLTKDDGVIQDSVVLTEQIRTIDKKRLHKYVATVQPRTMKRAEAAILTSFGIREKEVAYA